MAGEASEGCQVCQAGSSLTFDPLPHSLQLPTPGEVGEVIQESYIYTLTGAVWVYPGGRSGRATAPGGWTLVTRWEATVAEMEPGAVSQRGETQVRAWFLLQAALLAASRPQVPTSQCQPHSAFSFFRSPPAGSSFSWQDTSGGLGSPSGNFFLPEDGHVLRLYDAWGLILISNPIEVLGSEF